VGLDRALAPGGERCIGCPGADLDPFGDVEQETAEAIGTHGADRSRVGFGTVLGEDAAGFGMVRVSVALAQRLQHVGRKDIKIAGRSKLVRDPLQLALDPLLLGIGDLLGKYSDGRAQPAQTDAHLVQCLGLARTHS
jgi:hypothetical protein